MKKFVKKSKFETGDNVIVVKSYLVPRGGYKIHERRTAVVIGFETFGSKTTFNIKMDDDGVETSIPEERIEATK